MRADLVILWDFRSGLWFQETVAKMFNTCRIPQLHCDSLSPQPPPHVPNARKLLVMVNDWTYAIEAYDENRQLLSVNIIEQHLRSVVHDATQRMQAGEEAVPVGILSADHRDRWTEVCSVLTGICATSLFCIEPQTPPLPLPHKPEDPQNHPTVDLRRQS